MIDESAVREALKTVQSAELNRTLVERGLIRDIDVVDGAVRVQIQLTSPIVPSRARSPHPSVPP
ncbi:MAG TPA: iron-sulfur cluster assembly protein [Gammaproteobacteria bacterium]|nr:iron-sulfur cluster assembly protein [Gammaproteobacteria bacterium]